MSCMNGVERAGEDTDFLLLHGLSSINGVFAALSGKISKKTDVPVRGTSVFSFVFIQGTC